MSRFRRVVFLSGGVGGARLLQGLAQVLPAERLTVVVNTGDDFVHWGLHVSPDLDTVMYSLSGASDEARGWGLAQESFRTLSRMQAYGAPSWFALGDLDLATHLVRSEALRAGRTLTEVTAQLAAALGVTVRILPMCDQPRPTYVETEEFGALSFQSWLVEHGAPPVRAIAFRGGNAASDAVLAALDRAELVVMGPSNPYVSIDPILTLAGVRARLREKTVIAVSPIVRGAAIKGPLSHMIRSLQGQEPSPSALLSHYGETVSAMVIEEGDSLSPAHVPRLATRTVMRTLADKVRLAREVMAFAERL